MTDVTRDSLLVLPPVKQEKKKDVYEMDEATDDGEFSFDRLHSFS